ncbi:MAG: hypothetical protein DRH24_15460 [Deltaproteobacteria bacterium]|nr:MAG: hypothetical protein DRH24_15460 [Deltaproteobacteria bacterium]
MKKIYPESKVEVTGFTARYYDIGLDIATLGRYLPFMKQAIQTAKIEPKDKILDLGAGTGRNARLLADYLDGEGELIGVDVSDDMIAQFEKRCADLHNVKIVNRRIDQTLPYKNEFTKVFISFVLHGFPQSARMLIIKNAFKALKDGGKLLILDYNEFLPAELPFYLKVPFKMLECPYAFDFIEKDWKKILAETGFNDFEEHFFFRRFIRLLSAVKLNSFEQ